MTLQTTTYATGIRAITATSADSLESIGQALAREVEANAACFALLFFSQDRFEAEAISDLLSKTLPALPYAGCSSAGEISPDANGEGGLLAILFPADGFRIASAVLADIASISLDQIAAQVTRLQATLGLDQKGRRLGAESEQRSFAVSLIDGLSAAEESVVSALNWALEGIPLIGGSSADDLRFERTSLIANNFCGENAAVLILVETRYRFHIFKTDNFLATDERLVVTACDPDRRIVHELNAAPAAREYATALGLDAEALDQMSFASYPLVIKVGGEFYCRSIQRSNPDGSLSFFCAIDDGIVLSLARATDLVEATRRSFEATEGLLGKTDMVLGFDCVQRRVDAENRQLTRQMSDLYRKHHVVGFQTFGEQYRAMHLNQTFTGIAFAAEDSADLSGEDDTGPPA